ncbi:MBL fold metallo-hydrolase [Methanobrevibacter filiformis]|uniref:Putative metallo-hydrolase YflN n=1 Tax=Methanobrevibacter filiformis TaxID=55758 RepID=A0A165Z4E2_9EURY|nr:MBL fold metallo-hydrolase [Methanobrevibacter filiformis]KZX10233.1 putative metallo-hydrolase YflN [Methanobrevibacter filiformis]
MEKITDNIWFIQGLNFDSNSYLLDNIIIDTGTGMNQDYLYSELKTINYNPKDIEMIVNTHCHFDHVGGNYLFEDAKVAIHKDDAPPLEHDNDPLTAATSIFSEAIKRHDVDLKLKEGDKIVNFEVLHTPGHSHGGICLWNGETLISGDTVFSNGGFGRLDIGGNLEDMGKSLERLSKLDVKYLLPGHGFWTIDGKKHIEMANNLFKTMI